MPSGFLCTHEHTQTSVPNGHLAHGTCNLHPTIARASTFLHFFRIISIDGSVSWLVFVFSPLSLAFFH